LEATFHATESLPERQDALHWESLVAP